MLVAKCPNIGKSAGTLIRQISGGGVQVESGFRIAGLFGNQGNLSAFQGFAQFYTQFFL